ncbi:transcription factor AP-4-like [Chanos chanos]|uniref:Transcription factor AP-4-like n=1 Tax=Chanos chanos TaxID=29144 RepID=A0A6J2W2H2_CHACN|nr:transcription factor AP-4-like [Chanos chanos]
MEYLLVSTEKVPSLQQYKKTDKDVIGGLCSLAKGHLTPETARDQERRLRREIANSNERRRMQSINAGFQSLKTLIPHSSGEKLSKAAILQQTADYIYSLEQEKTQLQQQNSQLQLFIQEITGSSPKRKRTEEKDEGIGSPDTPEEDRVEDFRRDMLDLRQQLEKERSMRMLLEEQIHSLGVHLHSEKKKVITQQVQEENAHVHSQTLQRLQQQHDTCPNPPPAPTHHPTVIVPARMHPLTPQHVTVVTMSPTSTSSTLSTSRQNLDAIVQAIQHIEGYQRVGGAMEEQRKAVIVTPRRISMDTTGSDTDSYSEGEDYSA